MSIQNLSEELNRFNEINKYVKTLLNEQDAPVPADPGVDPMAGGVPPTDPMAAGTPPVDPTAAGVPPTDPTAAGVPPTDPTAGAPAEDTTEEIDITDLVNMTKSIKKDLEDNKNNNGSSQKMDELFNKLNDLEIKLQGMDELLNKIDNLEIEVKNSKPKSPEEKLEMRSLDSYPFNENPQQFFDKKLPEMNASGKNDYVLTKDDVQNYSKNDIMKSFNSDETNNLGY